MIDDQMEMDEARRATRLAALLTLTICVIGVTGMWLVKKYELWRRSMFYEQFLATEGPGIALVAVFAIAVLVMLRRVPAGDDLDPARPMLGIRVPASALALAVLVVTVAGTYLVFKAYPFVDDEYAARFQGAIFAQGQRAATLPPTWCPYITAMSPLGIAASGCTWQLDYFPVNAMIHGAFAFLRLEAVANPVMAGLSVVLVHHTVRRAWPDQPERATLAALLLATSSQFLLMSMSAFSMPAHLLASAAWLWLFVRPERWALIALPWLGVIALGVHSPFPHVMFVAPFVVSYLFAKRYAAFAYLAIVYALGALAWVGRLDPASGGATSTAGAATAITTNVVVVARRLAGDPVTGAMSLTVLATWNVPIAMLAVLLTLLLWKRLGRFGRWLAVSLLFTLVARAVFFGTYGAGWGHRYAYAVLPNLVILAAIGIAFLAQALGRQATRRLVAAALLSAVVIALPLRGVQAARIVAPYARASAYLERLPADVVVVPFDLVQWGRQLLRNDPFLRNSPKLMSQSDLRPSALDSLRSMFPDRVQLVHPRELEALGVKRATRIGRFEIR